VYGIALAATVTKDMLWTFKHVIWLDGRNFSDREYAEWLVYLGKEEKGIYTSMLILVCHLANLPCLS
jgi:hypothetical protein